MFSAGIEYVGVTNSPKNGSNPDPRKLGMTVTVEPPHGLWTHGLVSFEVNDRYKAFQNPGFY